MFERFTADARNAVVTAQEVARRTDADRIDSVHLLLAVAEQPGVGGAALAAAGGTPEALGRAVREDPRVDGLDADALAALGIDLEAVRTRADETFGPGALSRAGGRRRGGHIPFTRDAKKMLEFALREAVRLGDRHIDSGHLVLAVVRLDDSSAYRVLVRTGADPEALRRDVVARRDHGAA